MENKLKKVLGSLKRNVKELILWVEWLCGWRKILQSGMPRYGNHNAASQLYNLPDSDADGYLVYSTSNSYPVRIDLKYDRLRIGRFLKDEEGVENVFVEDSSVSDERIEIIRTNKDGFSRYYIKNANEDSEIRIGDASLAELSKNDPPDQPGHELSSKDVITMSRLQIVFYRRPPSHAKGELTILPKQGEERSGVSLTFGRSPGGSNILTAVPPGTDAQL